MFSGFKYIFGYNEETAVPVATEATVASVPKENKDLTASLATSTETSANKLEQTLNAATTKFTEQLLPQQASIEELQSSSHQLLPSIIEQHEEDELKKKSSTCEIIDVEDDEEEDGFNAESWELLDLVENTEDEVAPVSQTSSVQGGESLSKGLCKSTSGILKSQSTHDNKENDNSHKRQKPKVSFEAAELVKSKQEIEKTESNVTEASGSRKDVVDKSELVGNVDCKKVPTLNYAKALSKKLTTDAPASTSEASPGSYGSTLNASSSLGPVKRVRPTRVSISSWSSHDEEDDIEQVNNADWGEVSYGKPTEDQVFNVQANDADDNESLISSGFSDCDYGFGGINDYVMRPKRANVKRGRTISTSSSSALKMRPARPDRKVATVKAKLASASEAKVEDKSAEAGNSKSDAPRNSKPRKKRMIMSANKSVNLSDFLKYRPSSSSKEVAKQDSSKIVSEASQQAVQKPVASVGGGSGSTESSDIAEMDESWFVTPPPCFTKAVKTDNLEKVESPKTKDDDQENALIEHPSVYIASAASKNQNKAKNGMTTKSRSAGISKMKNVSSKIDSTGKNLMTLEDESWNSGDDEEEFGPTENQTIPMDTVAKVNREDAASGNEKGATLIDVASEPATEMDILITAASSKVQVVKKKAPKLNEKVGVHAKSSTVISKPSENKAWKNKFIVDVWDLDDNVDVDSDFDSMFESTKKRKSIKPKKQQAKQVKVKEAANNVRSQESIELVSFDYSSPSPVELLSVKSLVSLELEDRENLTPSVAPTTIHQQFCGQSKENTSPALKCNAEHRKPPIQVRPIEPERVPSWKLKRQRSKRRPLASVAVVSKQQQPCSVAGPPKTLKVKGEQSASASSSSRSTPTLIDRIGCSIVANLTNLTSGLVSSGAMNYCPSSGQGPMVENQGKAVANKSNFNNSSAALATRKQMSRGSIRRQNICAKQANTLRRPDRRLKLFATPNGCSINRKVHTSIH